MAKSVEDCADVMDILLPGRGFRSSLKRSWKGVRIAFLNYEKWQWDDEDCKRVPEYDEQHVGPHNVIIPSSTLTI
jgi:amidase